MRAKHLLFSLAMACAVSLTQAATHTVSNSGTTFTPAEITITVGDIINFDIGGSHNVVEVSEETWNANGSTSNGGFSLGFGGGELTFNDAGTFYYVCEPHASIGMKGKVVVEAVTNLTDVVEDQFPLLHVYPNPAREFATMDFNLDTGSQIRVSVFDITGKEILVVLEGYYGAGEYSQDLDLTGVQPGRYFIYFRANDEVRVQSLSRVR